MGPYAGVDYNLTLCPLQSRLNTFTTGNPMPESTPFARVGFYLQVRGFGLGGMFPQQLELVTGF